MYIRLHFTRDMCWLMLFALETKVPITKTVRTNYKKSIVLSHTINNID